MIFYFMYEFVESLKKKIKSLIKSESLSSRIHDMYMFSGHTKPINQFVYTFIKLVSSYK